MLSPDRRNVSLLQDYKDTASLRYGHIMIMTDQDHDGSHIKGLLMNFMHHFYPSLLKVPGFLIEFITPIVKARSYLLARPVLRLVLCSPPGLSVFCATKQPVFGNGLCAGGTVRVAVDDRGRCETVQALQWFLGIANP